MLRAVSSIYLEGPALELLVASRRDVYKLLRIKRLCSTSSGAVPGAGRGQTVLASEPRTESPRAVPPRPAPPPPPHAPPPPRPRRAWASGAAALAVTASLGGAYLYRRLQREEPPPSPAPALAPAPAPAGEPEPYPSSGAQFPSHVQYLLVGGGTASFAAMRALRAARPDAAVLLVGDEPLPPYMRPPLSKELWREPDLAAAADGPGAAPSFRQWNGRRRPLLYEPLAFYAPLERLGDGGAAAARGWRVTRLDVARHTAELRAPGREPVTVSYERCLVAPGVRPRRLEVLREARAAGRSLAVRGVADAARLAALLDARPAAHVALVGGGLLAGELAAALAARLAPAGGRVTQLCRGEAVLARVLPPYLAAEAARHLRAAGVRLLAGTEVTGATLQGEEVVLQLRGGAAPELRADVVVECVGAETDAALARASGLELTSQGALAGTAELVARADVWVAGDAASWHDAALGRRTAQHHDHAVHSGRRAGENMAAPAAQRAYDHQPMFWSDLGPELGYEAIGIVDASLPTVGVFSAADVSEAGVPGAADATEDVARRYSRGVVFYRREGRVVGVLLWNLFNRMHVARQVLARGEFDDLVEVAKLFSLHEDD